LNSQWAEPSPPDYFRVMFYGWPGIGKTTSVLTRPPPIRILDPENSSLALVEANCQSKDIKRRVITSFTDCQLALQELKDEKVSGGTIVFDTLTQIQRRHIRELAGTNIPGRREYYQDTYGLGRMYSAFAQLPMHVIYICGQDTHEVGEGDKKQIFWVPDLTPALMKELMQVCDALGYMYLDPVGNQCLTFNPTRQWYAKRRHPRFPKEVIIGTINWPGIGRLIDWQAILNPRRESNGRG